MYNLTTQPDTEQVILAYRNYQGKALRERTLNKVESAVLLARLAFAGRKILPTQAGNFTISDKAHVNICARFLVAV